MTHIYALILMISMVLIYILSELYKLKKTINILKACQSNHFDWIKVLEVGLKDVRNRSNGNQQYDKENTKSKKTFELFSNPLFMTLLANALLQHPEDRQDTQNKLFQLTKKTYCFVDEIPAILQADFKKFTNNKIHSSIDGRAITYEASEYWNKITKHGTDLPVRWNS